MQFKGTITKAMPIATGTSKAGKEWKRATYVLTYDNSNEQYPKSLLFDVMGDKIEQLNIQQGKEYEIEVDFSTREYNERTYMSASAWRATEVITQQATQTPTSAASDSKLCWEQLYAPQKPTEPQATPQTDNVGDPLPF